MPMKLSLHPLFTSGQGQPPPPVPRDEPLADRLERSFRALAARGDAFVGRFYERLFSEYPHLRPLFRQDIAVQRKKLLDSLTLVIDHLRQPEMVQAALAELGRRHVEYGARPEHYPIVRECLLAAMGEAAGADWSRELEADWRTALSIVCNMMLAGTGGPADSARR